jgi:hypothetical protein
MTQDSLVFLPLSGKSLRAFAERGALPGDQRGFAATPAMLSAFGLEVTDEGTDHTLLAVASVAGFLEHGERLVAVLETSFADSDSDFGEVGLSDPAFDSVVSVFVASPQWTAAVEPPPSTLAEAWDHPGVVQLLSESDQLWYGPSEWEAAIGAL